MKISDIHDPIDLKNLDNNDLIKLSSSIREEIIKLSKIKKIHLSSNLGIVEISISLLKHFPDIKNKIFYDAGHQCYVHKMLTNRFDKIKSIREYNGLSGFQSNEESEYDFFSSGHSGNSLSIAQGFIESNDDTNIIVVIGDAAISNGLSFEALNNIGFNKNKMLIILNDNGMSISKNVGSLSNTFNKIFYKNYFYNFIKKNNNEKKVLKFINLEKKINRNNIFHDLGFYYIGQINGHNFKELNSAIKKGIFYSKFLPTIIHAKTIKGKGLSEDKLNNPKYHSCELNKKDLNDKTFSDLSADFLFKKLKENNKIKIINAAMTYSSGFDKIANSFPLNYEDVGINEEHSVSKSTGIILSNKKAIVSIYSTFLQRTYDQILNDVAREKKPVLFIVDRSDLSYGDGDTHHGIYDLGMIKSIPNTIITMPSTKNELKQLINIGLKNKENTFFIRITNEKPIKDNKEKVYENDWIYLLNKSSSKTCIISYGNWINRIYDKYQSKNVDILNAIFIKGFDEHKILHKIRKYNKIIFYERVYKEGTLYKDILDLLNKNNLNIKCYLISFEKNNIGFGDFESLNRLNKMTINEIDKYL